MEKLLWKNVTIVNGTTLVASLGSSGDGDDTFFLGGNGTLQLSVSRQQCIRTPRTCVSSFSLKYSTMLAEVTNFHACHIPKLDAS